VSEATLGNLAFRIDGRWVTPLAAAGLLPGVEREAWLADGTLTEAEVSLADLGRAERVAFLNAVRGWLPAVLVRPEDRLRADRGPAKLTRAS
jgi:para-aminobenzoate synthetase/4-amino-4-deoxychorismate lyase